MAWKYYYSSTSSGDHGTMYQLRNLIGRSGDHGTIYQLCNLIDRSNVSPKPVKAFSQCSDFFKLVVVCHVVASALKHLSMASLANTPNIRGVQEVCDLWLETAEKKEGSFTICMRGNCGQLCLLPVPKSAHPIQR